MRAPWLLSVATAFVLLGASIAAFLNPVWVGFEQGRVGVWQNLQPPACTGVDRAAITDSILHDLVLGGEFDVRFGQVACTGFTARLTNSFVLNDAERSHMGDVRGVFAAFGLLILASVVLLVVTWRRSRDHRPAWWRAVRAGGMGLAVIVAVLGAISLVAFDAAFEVFHELFFAKGTYSFDPATSRLVQLFPDQFWSETTLALGAVAIVLAAATAWVATRRIAAEADSPARTPGTLPVGRAARP